MQFTLIVLNAPWQGQAAQTALRFARAALAAGHGLRQVLFYGDGALALAPSGGPGETERGWAALGQAHGVPLIACATAAARRGIEWGAASRPAPSAFVAPGTLGQAMVALPESDRLLTFAD